jgi:hypothetical protein
MRFISWFDFDIIDAIERGEKQFTHRSYIYIPVSSLKLVHPSATL